MSEKPPFEIVERGEVPPRHGKRVPLTRGRDEAQIYLFALTKRLQRANSPLRVRMSCRGSHTYVDLWLEPR